MTILTTTSQLMPPTASSPPGIVAMFRAWQTRRSNRRALLALLELEDHCLRDIGLTRGDVAALLRGKSSL